MTTDSTTEPEQRAGIRRLTGDDTGALLAILDETLPDTMAARLGERFNTLYFRAVLEEPLCYTDGFFVDGRLAGFLAYSPSASEMLRRVVRRNTFAFAGATLVGLVTFPSKIGVVARVATSILARVPEPGSHVAAEMLSMGVLADYRGRREVAGRTIRIGHELAQRAFTVLRAAGASHVKAFVKPQEVEPVARGFWTREGCIFVDRVRRFGVAADLLIKDLRGETGQ